MQDDLKALVKQQLTWADRHLTFKKQLRMVPHLPTGPNEEIVSLLVGRLLDHVSLFLLTTDKLYRVGAITDTDVMWWEGPTIQMFRVHGNAIRVDLIPGVTAPGSPDYIEITGVDPQKANTFLAIANLLCLPKLWGNPAGFLEALENAGRENGDQTIY